MSSQSANPEPEQEIDLPRRGYFIDAEIVLHARHPDPGQFDLTKWVGDLWTQAKLGDYPYKIMSTVTFGLQDSDLSVEYTYAQKVVPESTFAEKAADVNPADLPQASITSLVHLRIGSLAVHKNYTHPTLDGRARKLAGIVRQLNKTPRENNDTNTTLLEAIPNWCLTGSAHSATDPGPGALPKPVPASAPQIYNFVADKAFAAISKFPNAVAQAQKVNVVIFDTVPPEDVLAYAYQHFIPGNDLLEDIKGRADAGQFTIKYASKLGIDIPPNITETSPGEYLGYAHHDMYDMSDHGLFIAGIIHGYVSIPNMHIYLVQTQNDYGVGSISSLAAGINALLQGDIIPKAEMDYPLIVNCSLCVSFAKSKDLVDACFNIKDQDCSDNSEAKQTSLADEVASLKDPLQRLQTRFSRGGVRIIAAAGNDSSPRPAGMLANTPLPTPENTRFPAAFDFVIGVGSIENTGKRAFYSNTGDVPPQRGLMLSGGKAERRADGLNHTDETGEGILGLYVGQFPNEAALGKGLPSLKGTASLNGWAWWAGTSFATAIMSGMFALGAASNVDISLGANPDYLSELIKHKDGDTDEPEPYIKTPQRP